jgi:two-component sensor histidine kinase/PAS domain-containing protein
MLVWTLTPIILITAAVGIPAYIGGRTAVGNAVAQLVTEANGRIEDRVKGFLSVPPNINEVNTRELESGQISPGDPAALQRHLLTLLRANPSVTSIYFGNSLGGLINAGREGPGGAEYLIDTLGFRAGQFRKQAVDGRGAKGATISTMPHFDARTRPWYKEALAAGKPAWTDVFVLFTGQDLAISAVRPAFGEGGALLGVFAVDIFLSQLSDFLRGINEGSEERSFILDRDGFLVASSAAGKLSAREGEGASHRITGAAADDPIIAAASKALASPKGTGRAGPSPTGFSLAAKRYLTLASPLREPAGLGWTIVSVFPEAVFMARIVSNSAETVLVVALAIVIALVLCLFLANSIGAQFRRLMSFAHEISADRWHETEGSGALSRVLEIEDLRASLLSMNDRLRDAFGKLTAEVEERRRTETSLIDSKHAYDRLAKNIPVGVYLYRSGSDGGIRYEYVSPRYREIYGIDDDDIASTSSASTKAIHPDDLESYLRVRDEAMGMVVPLAWEGRIIVRGELRWIRKESKPEVQADGDFLWDGMVTDITEAKRAEERIGSLLAEKEMILKEVHHRIKNNMASVSAILSLQAESQDDPRVATALDEACGRVQSMMILYDKLYRSDSFLTESAAEHLGDIADMVATHYSHLKGVTLEKRLEVVLIESKKLMPLGIIANELLTNAYKYAYPGGGPGKILMSLSTEGGRARLVVRDDGVGMGNSVPKTGFGYTLVGAFASQLEGRLDVVSAGGSRVELSFPV